MSETELGDRYLLGEVIGRGGAAEVHRARDRVLDRAVAVKLLRESVDDADRARFVGEARVLARLSHPGLVTVLDAGTSGARPFLVMELVEGPTLAAGLREGPLPLARAADVGSQVAGAVAYAHGQGVVHRDVKPGNVLLGGHGVVKLADFGIARLIGDTVRHTKTGVAIGTPAYLAPEQVTGAEVGPPADVYALGLVLLEAVTGERAFPGTPTEAAMARLHRPPEIPADLPSAWRSLLGEMTATEPAARPSAEAVSERLAGLAVVPAGPGSTRIMPVPPVGPASSVDAPTEPMPSAPATGGNLVGGPAVPAAAATGGWMARLRALPVQARAVLLVVVLLLVLIVAVVVATSGGSDPGDERPGDTQSPSGEPASTPTTPSESAPTGETAPDSGDEGGDEGGGEENGNGEDQGNGKGKGKGKGKSEGKGR